MNRRIQRRVLEDTETSSSACLCVLQNSALKLRLAARTAWFMAPMRVQCWRSRLPMNLTLLESLKRLGFLQKGSAGRSTVDNTTPSPQAGGGDRRRKLGPPPTRPTHQTEKANLPNGNTLAGVTKQSYCRVSEPISPTGTKAPESLAATLHAAATEVESPRFMGTIKHCPRRSSLSMNHKVGRVTPCAPSSHSIRPGAHGVTRPTAALWFRGSRREKSFRGILPSWARPTTYD